MLICQLLSLCKKQEETEHSFMAMVISERTMKMSTPSRSGTPIGFLTRGQIMTFEQCEKIDKIEDNIWCRYMDKSEDDVLKKVWVNKEWLGEVKKLKEKTIIECNLRVMGKHSNSMIIDLISREKKIYEKYTFYKGTTKIVSFEYEFGGDGARFWEHRLQQIADINNDGNDDFIFYLSDDTTSEYLVFISSVAGYSKYELYSLFKKLIKVDYDLDGIDNSEIVFDNNNKTFTIHYSNIYGQEHDQYLTLGYSKKKFVVKKKSANPDSVNGGE